MTYSAQARVLYAEGVVLYASGDYAGAIAKWQAVTQLPGSGELHERATTGLERAQRIQQIMAAGAAPATAPGDPAARQLYAEGVTHYAEGRYGEAIAKWNQVITHANPGDLADRSADHVDRARRILDRFGDIAEDERQAWQGLSDWLSNPNGALRHIGGSGTICWCGKTHPDHTWYGGPCWCGKKGIHNVGTGPQ